MFDCQTQEVRQILELKKKNYFFNKKILDFFKWA